MRLRRYLLPALLASLMVGAEGAPPPTPPPVRGRARLVNSKRIRLTYSLERVGKSGVSIVELWYTQDGRRWQKYNEYPGDSRQCVFAVHGEGLYGFTLAARPGVGKAPQPGDEPQVWVEVDLTKPAAELYMPTVAENVMTIVWKVTDRNLAARPVRLFYAGKDKKGWVEIAAGLENTGRFAWQMPPDVPAAVFLRLEAVDLAGNVGVAETNQPTVTDAPEIRIRDVQAVPE